MTDRKQTLQNLLNAAQSQKKGLYAGYTPDPMAELDCILERQIAILESLIGTNLNEESDACRKCGGPMYPGKAFAITATGGSPDFPGDERAITFSARGPGTLVAVMKCRKCGWSVRR